MDEWMFSLMNCRWMLSRWTDRKIYRHLYRQIDKIIQKEKQMSGWMEIRMCTDGWMDVG